MKKITDERLVLRNLQHIKITYIVQTFGILCILGYEFFRGGLEGMRENPLWLVFILTTVVYAYLTMSVSVEHEQVDKHPKKSFVVSMIVLAIVATTTVFLTAITPGFNWTNGIVIGAIVWICGFIPIYYVYRLRLKQYEDIEDE